MYGDGSAVGAGPRPDSDVDLLLLTRRSLPRGGRAALVRLLPTVSGGKGHADRFPDAAGRRPLDLTSPVLADLRPLGAPPRRDFRYGEWLRAPQLAGEVPRPEPDGDVVVLLAGARQAHRVLRGPASTRCCGRCRPSCCGGRWCLRWWAGPSGTSGTCC